MENLKLFAAYLGGRADGCNIELHDVVFVVSPDIDSAYPQFVRKWFGNTERLHLDSHIELKYIDGHEVILSPVLSSSAPAEEDPKLYFINFGAYDTAILGEIHQCGFYVASEKRYAVSRAKEDLCKGLFQIHCDDSLNVGDLLDNEEMPEDVDDLIEITEVDGYRITLKPTNKTQKFETICGYRKITVR